MKARLIKFYPENIEEFWTIPGFVEDGVLRTFSYYLVHSKTGDIWTCKSGRYLRPTFNPPTGYMQTGMIDDDGRLYNQNQQRIVLAAKLQHWDFVEVNHINRVRHDNHPINLEPTDSIGNKDEIFKYKLSLSKRGSKAPWSKFTEEEVVEIRRCALDAPDLKEYRNEMAEKYGVHPTSIKNILEGKTWTHVEAMI